MNVYVFGTRGFPLVQGGVEKHCENLYPRMAHDAKVTVYRRKPYVSLSKNARYPGIRFVDLPSTRIKGFEALWHSFLSMVHILTQPSGIVHIHNIGPALFTPVLRLFGRKVVLTYHSPNHEHQKWNVIGRCFLKICEKIALKYACTIIFVNHFRMVEFSAGIQKKSYYIPNGIVQPVFSLQTDFLEKWGLQTAKYILSVGRITPEKGFDILLKAFSTVHSDYRLVIAGAPEAETDYFRQLTDGIDPDKIIFTGYVYGEPLNQLYTHASLFVLPSLQEGFPLVLLEAMSYRLPLVVSDIPATRLVTLSPDCYFPAGNAGALKNKITGFIHENQTSKPSYDLSPYNWEQIVKNTLHVFKRLSTNKQVFRGRYGFCF